MVALFTLGIWLQYDMYIEAVIADTVYLYYMWFKGLFWLLCPLIHCHHMNIWFEDFWREKV